MTFNTESLSGFCSAAWTDLIAYNDGSLRVCDRNIADFGNWQKDGLGNTWNSNSLQQFRKDTAEGRYPNDDCASCHNNGTQRTLISSLGCAYEEHYNAIERHQGKDFAREKFQKVHELFPLKVMTPKAQTILSETYNNLSSLEAKLAGQNLCKELRDALVKIRVILECSEDYLNGTSFARRVAPFRQAQLQAKCNARCVMCAGRYTGEIMNGPSMPTEYVNECFAHLEDVVDFWCNGSEYMLYKDWQKVATMLYNEGGTKLRVSTNGILLNEKNVHFMIDTGMLAHLTVSLDGATKEVLESIRINVKFEDNLSKIRHLIEYAGKKNHFYTLIFAFCFMKRNYQDLPKFMEMIHELRGVYKNNRVVALIQPLENFELPEYRKWVHKEHHDLIGESELQRVLQESHAFAKKHDIITSFYNMTLEEFLDKKMSMPPYFVRKMDEEVFLSRMEEIGKELDDVLGKNKENLESRFRAALLRKFREHLQASIQEYSEKSLSPSKVHSPSKKLEQMHLLLLKTIREQRKPLEQFLWDDRLKNSITKDIVNAFPIVHGALKIRIFEHADQFLHHLFAVGKELTPLYAQEMDKFLAENFEKHLFDWKEVYTVKNACLVNDLPLLYYSQKPNEMGFKISALVKSFSGYHLLKNGEIISAEQLKQNIALVFNKDGHAQKLNVYLVNAWSATEENSYVRAFLFFVVTHKIKKMIIGNRKSPLLWKLSQVYRAALATFGVQVTFIDGQ